MVVLFSSNSKLVTYNFLLDRALRLTKRLHCTGGRNNFGRITAYRVGSYRYRRLYRFVDFWRRLQSNAYVVKFERDSFRSAILSLVFYQTGLLSYIILPDSFSVGDYVNLTVKEIVITSTGLSRSKTIASILGQSMPLRMILNSMFVFNVEFWPNKGAQLCRSAGSSALIINHRRGFVMLKLRSGWRILVSDKCYATIGAASNRKHKQFKFLKAGWMVNVGVKPTVRGVAMNAVDHPHGGGRGKSSGGSRPLTPWGRITKRQPTVARRLRKRLSKIRFR